MNNFIKRTMILALALAMSLGAWAQQTVTWAPLYAVPGITSGSTTYQGVTLSGTGTVSSAEGAVTFDGNYTFSVADGSVITQIVIDCFSFSDASGWTFNNQTWHATWTGSAQSVAFSSTMAYSITFTIETAGPTATRTNDNTWKFAMPGYNTALGIEYKDYPQLAWTLGGSAMPNDTSINLYRGFDADFFASLGLTTSQAFAQSHPSSPTAQLNIPGTWSGDNTPLTANDLSGFVALTDEEAAAITCPNAEGFVRVIHNFVGDGYIRIIAFYNGEKQGQQSYTLARTHEELLNDVNGLDVKYYYTTTGGNPVRFGSTAPSVVTYTDGTGFQAVGTGTAKLYAVFDGDDDYLRDSVWFTLNLQSPDTLTLASNDTLMGRVNALLGSSTPATWNNQTWANMPTEGMLHSFTVGDITLSHTGNNYDGFIKDESSGDPLYIYNNGGNLTFTSAGAPFTRIEMKMVMPYSDYNPHIQPTDGWTFDGYYATWEGNAQSVTMTQCTTKVDVITFTRGAAVEGVVALNEAKDTLIALPGAQVQVVATAVDGNYLSAWSGINRAPANRLSDTATHTMSGNLNFTATFAQNPLLTLNAGQGGTVTLDGVVTELDQMMAHLSDPIAPYTQFSVFLQSNGVLKDNVKTLTNAQAIALAQRIAQATGNNNILVLAYTHEFFGSKYLTYGKPDGNTEGSTATMTNSNTIYTIYYVNTFDLLPETYPTGVAAGTTANTYRVLPGTQLSVTATPEETHYLVGFQGMPDTNSNQAVSYSFVTNFEPVTLTANFHAKPTLTLAANDTTWGKVEIPIGLVATDPTPAPTPTAVANPVITGVLMPDGSMQVTMSCTSPNTDIYYTTDNVTSPKCDCPAAPEYQNALTFTEPVTIMAAAYDGNNWSAVVTKTITLSLPDGVAKLTDSTYRVDYGAEVTVSAQATPLHHVQGWQDENGTEIAGATMSDYFIGEPQNLFPAKSTVTLTNITADRTARALFGINSYDVTATASLDNRAEVGTGLAMGTVGATYVAQDGTPNQSVTPAASITYTAQGGSQSTLTATPEYGYVFVGWVDQNNQNTLSTQNTLTLTEAATVQAVFAPDTFEVSSSLAIAGSATVSGTGEVAYRESTTLEATPETGYHFVNWTNNQNTLNIPSNPMTIQILGDTNLVAVMDTNVYNVTYTVQNDDRSEIGTGLAMGTVTLEGRHMHFLNDVLTATAAYGYTFAGWADQNGNIVSTENPFSFSPTGDVEYTALFEPRMFTVETAAVRPTLGSIEGAGSYAYLTPVTIEAVNVYGYHFWKWNDENVLQGHESPIGAVRTFTLTQDTSFTAYFAINEYTVTFSSSNAEQGTVTSSYPTIYHCNYLYTAFFKATPNYGYRFDHWSNGLTDDSVSFAIIQDTDMVAYFSPMPFSISATAADANTGTVSGSGAYNYLTEAILTATPEYGYHFTQWADGDTTNPRTVTVLGNAEYTAQFAKNQYTVTVVSGDTARGSASGTATVDYNTEVEISATANEHYHFDKWNDDVTTATRSVTVLGDITYTALFAPDSYTISGTANMGQGTVTGSATVEYLNTVILTAEPACGYLFDHWSNNETSGTIVITATEDLALTAYFRAAVVDTVTLHDTTIVEIHDTTTVALDTMYINVPDTNLVPVTLYDTTTVDVTLYDTTNVAVTLYDTTNVEVFDTTIVDVTLYDTTNVAVTLYDTTNVEVFDTTIVDVTLYDTTNVAVTLYDTTITTVPITLYDTTNVEVFDTTIVDVTLYDTTITTVPITLYDTTNVEVFDTTIVDVTLYDTTNVAVTVYDTTLVPVTVFDTTVTTVPVTVYDTTSVPVTVYDTTVTTVPVTVYDTTVTTIPVTVYDTTVTTVPVTVYDTTVTTIPVTVYDTTITTVPITVNDTTIVPVTEYDTTHVAVTVIDSTLVPITDTLWLTEYIHDTVYIEIHDTVYIHDTIFVGIDDVESLNAKIYANNGQIVVEGADGNDVVLYDVTGRILAKKRDEYTLLRFDIPASGTYLVKIGNHAARRIVMIR